MDNYKVVNDKGNEATESQIFGYLAHQLMQQAIDQLIEKGAAKVAGQDFTITEEAVVKLEGIKKHIADRWDKPIKAVKVVQKSQALEWEI
tara:strand:+ start:256 stop:525 length:270 start_codon:yes stop_codon:yes gene_type:complete